MKMRPEFAQQQSTLIIAQQIRSQLLFLEEQLNCIKSMADALIEREQEEGNAQSV